MRFADYVRQNVLAPAHMGHTRVDDLSAVIPNRARGYRLAIDGNIESCALADSSNKIPGGGFISTAEDLVRFATAVERGRLVGDATRARMFTPAHTRDGRSVPYGLGWVILERGGTRWVGHSGAQPGISTYLLASPSDGLAVAVLANLEGLNLEPLSVSIAEILLRSGNCAITRDRSLSSRATSHPGTP
jgi:CubicO group peptidase (beta-lactamase class C family)